MSQMSEAFARAPSNFHTEKAKAFLAANAPGTVAPVEQAPSAPPQNTVLPQDPIPVPQPHRADTLIPRAPASPQQVSAMPVTIPTQQPQVQAQAQPPVAPQPQNDPLVQQLMAERQQLTAQLQQQQQALQNFGQVQQELATLKRNAELSRTLSNLNFSELEGVDPEDAQRISAAVLTAAQAPMDQLRQELMDQRKAMQDAFAQQQQALHMNTVNQRNAEIERVHPDFLHIMSTPEYKAFMSQPDGLSYKTRDQRAAEEYSAGNTAFIIDMLNQLKGATPAAGNIATVAPVQYASATVAPVDAKPAEPLHTLKELNDLYGMRRITHDQYRAELAKLRAAQQI